MKSIRIIKPPIGEAPIHIRSAWVGCVLPLAYPTKVRTPVFGVLSGPPKSRLLLWLLLRFGKKLEGYVVESATTISILEQNSPDAGAWWKTNTPALLKKGQEFVFDAEACEEVESQIWPPSPRQD